MDTQSNGLAEIAVVPTDGPLGAEIKGVDLSKKLSQETVLAIRQSLLDHCVLFIRRQSLDDDDQVKFTNYFGKAGIHVRDMPDRAIKEILLISNIKKNGQNIGALGDHEVEFHSDLAYMCYPGMVSVLYAVEVPEHGGQTRWGNCYAAYEALDESMKGYLSKLRAVHQHPDTPLNPIEPIDHPVVCSHPETGRKSLYVSPMFTRMIVGMEKRQSDALVKEITDHVIRPEFIWTHNWQVGDLVIWDNRPTIHSRGKFPSEQRRLMKRTQTFCNARPST